jgi:iron complex outermembrane receptor protein
MLAESSQVVPQAERLNDLEVGYKYDGRSFYFGANFYYMDYDNQFVLSGAQDSNGEMVARNIKDSYRMGVELQAAVKLPFGLKWEANVTLSKNRIKNFSETLYGYDADWNELPAQTIEHGTTHIAFSPSLVASQQLSYEYKGFFARLSTQYVGEQYMSNADVAAHKLEDYCISNLDLAYTFRQLGSVESATIGFRVNNLFNKAYENNGWASSEYLNTPDNRVSYTGYAAQARTNFMAHLTLKF